MLLYVCDNDAQFVDANAFDVILLPLCLAKKHEDMSKLVLILTQPPHTIEEWCIVCSVKMCIVLTCDMRDLIKSIAQDTRVHVTHHCGIGLPLIMEVWRLGLQPTRITIQCKDIHRTMQLVQDIQRQMFPALVSIVGCDP